MKLNENKAIYAETERKIKFGLDIFSYGMFGTIAACLAPFILVAYHWCLGKYTIDSWFFFSPVW